ncbi:ATP-binding protein, partial [Streptomyces sp. NPDC000941]
MLHERGAELAQISGALRTAREGGPSLVLLTGPLGIGRSALLQRLAARAVNEVEDVRVLRANAAPVEQDFAFGVVRQLFDSLLAGAPGELSERWTRESACFANLALSDLEEVRHAPAPPGTAPRRVVAAPEYAQYEGAAPPCDAPHRTT